MAILFVPPVEIVSPNPELSQALKEIAAQYLDQTLGQINVTNKKDVYKGKKENSHGDFIPALKGFEFEGPDDLLLMQKIWATGTYAKTTEPNSLWYLKTSTVVRAKDCVELGNTWAWNEAHSVFKAVPKASQIRGPAIAEICARKTKNITTLRLESHFSGNGAAIYRPMLEVFSNEALGSQGMVLNSSGGQIFCAWTKAKKQDATLKSEKEELSKYPERTHRYIVSYLDFLPGKKTSEEKTFWPEVNGRISVHSSLFAMANSDEWKTQGPFDPVNLSVEIVQRAKKLSQSVSEASFKVLKREGRWIYLDHGRAYGLVIGQHLLGPNNEELHVIHFATPEKDLPDVAVALVRKESNTSPIKKGDIIKYDSRNFPPWDKK